MPEPTIDRPERYLEPTQESGAALVARQISGSIVMLNLLRFREVADYSATPELAPSAPISGAEAYQRYVEHTLPYLRASGGDIVFLGKRGAACSSVRRTSAGTLRSSCARAVWKRSSNSRPTRPTSWVRGTAPLRSKTLACCRSSKTRASRDLPGRA